MRKNGLQVRPLLVSCGLPSDHDNPIFPNLAAVFSPTGPNELWVANLTHVADPSRNRIADHPSRLGILCLSGCFS
jgi:hypothetical protein